MALSRTPVNLSSIIHGRSRGVGVAFSRFPSLIMIRANSSASDADEDGKWINFTMRRILAAPDDVLVQRLNTEVGMAQTNRKVVPATVGPAVVTGETAQVWWRTINDYKDRICRLCNVTISLADFPSTDVDIFCAMNILVNGLKGISRNVNTSREVSYTRNGTNQMVSLVSVPASIAFFAYRSGIDDIYLGLPRRFDKYSIDHMPPKPSNYNGSDENWKSDYLNDPVQTELDILLGHPDPKDYAAQPTSILLTDPPVSSGITKDVGGLIVEVLAILIPVIKMEISALTPDDIAESEEDAAFFLWKDYLNRFTLVDKTILAMAAYVVQSNENDKYAKVISEVSYDRVLQDFETVALDLKTGKAKMYFRKSDDVLVFTGKPFKNATLRKLVKEKLDSEGKPYRGRERGRANYSEDDDDGQRRRRSMVRNTSRTRFRSASGNRRQQRQPISWRNK